MQQDSMNKDALGVRTGGMTDRLRDAKKAVFEAGHHAWVLRRDIAADDSR
jgi:hypothetical protein